MNELVRLGAVSGAGQSDQLVKTIEGLDDDEVRTLISIKDKLNSGLPDRAKLAADTVGGFVW